MAGYSETRLKNPGTSNNAGDQSGILEDRAKGRTETPQKQKDSQAAQDAEQGIHKAATSSMYQIKDYPREQAKPQDGRIGERTKMNKVKAEAVKA